jgi:hypothetical protein
MVKVEDCPLQIFPNICLLISGAGVLQKKPEGGGTFRLSI